MEILIRETMYVTQNGQDYVIGHSTIGVERKNIIYFYDTTKTVAVGFTLAYCKENRNLFLLNRSITDREVSVRQIVKIIETMPTNGLAVNEIIRILAEKIKSL